MAKVKIKGIEEATKAAKEVFKDTKTSTKVLVDVGKLVQKRIVATARTGYSLEDNQRKKFRSLKESTVESREALEKTYPERIDREFFKPDRANVTLTGQLLEAFKFKIDKAKGLVFFFFKDERKKITPDDSSSNNEVYDNLQSLGYGFTGLDEKGQKRVKKIVLDEFRRNIKKIFK